MGQSHELVARSRLVTSGKKLTRVQSHYPIVAKFQRYLKHKRRNSVSPILFAEIVRGSKRFEFFVMILEGFIFQLMMWLNDG